MTQISRKYDFLPGTKIYSNQIDDEFNQLVTESNSQDTRIVAVETELNNAESSLHTHGNKTVLDKITQSGTETTFDLSEINNQISSLSANKQDALGYTPVNKAGDTMTGELKVPTIRITSPTDASETSTGHGLQIGESSQLNLIMDSNEVICRNNGVLAQLNLIGSSVNISTGAGSGAVWHRGELRINNGRLEFFDGVTWKGAGGVKNVQRGVASLTTGTATNITISAVDLNKSFVEISYTGSRYYGSDQSHALNARARLTSATNLELWAKDATTGIPCEVAWEVIEYA